MSYGKLLTENELDLWVRSHAEIAQGVIVELIWRLVAASSPNPKERRFPLGDSIGQHGPDGVLDVLDASFEPFVPDGRSLWEIGTSLDAGKKATDDYKDRVTDTPLSVRSESVFVFVTPLSGRRDWDYTWKEDAQANWLEKRRKSNEWRDVRIIDGTKLIDWLHQFPSVERWLAYQFKLPVDQLETPEHHWNELSTFGAPPPLTPHLFLANRDNACTRLRDILTGNTLQLKLDTYFPGHVVDFVSAFIAEMDNDSRVDILGRSIFVSGKDAWSAIMSHSEPHVLVIDSDLEPDGIDETRLLQKARPRHAVIYRGAPGGIPHPNCEMLPDPKSYQIEEALRKAGYSEERARILAHKSGGNLSTLLRCLQNLSLMPEWAEGTAAAELAIAELLGSWNERSEADGIAVEGVSGKLYGEWIGRVREAALRPGTPLTHRDGIWKFVPRYEAWYALGRRVFDEHLKRLLEVVVTVLREKDPKFELLPDERFAARVQGKILRHSDFLRNGLAETLALLGSHPEALKSCASGEAEATAVLAVREILADADWVLWASLNDLLPLLAEAAPREFLDAVENALNNVSCPFDELFAQERPGITGSTLLSGLLWALETLAWDADYLTRVTVALGELAARDPGGTWANRPANSLRTILLPWLPQTCAPLAKRRTAVEILSNEIPSVAWELLVQLLSRSRSTSSGSRKPAWRQMIPEDWSKNVTVSEYLEQTALYGDLAISTARTDHLKLVELIERMEDLPNSVSNKLLTQLESNSLLEIPETGRVILWNALMDSMTKLRRFTENETDKISVRLSRIAAIAERLRPDTGNLRYQRLFSERDFELFEEESDYKDQMSELQKRRKEAVETVIASGGTPAVLEFAQTVESSWRVGFAFGTIAERDAENVILPGLLLTEQKALAQFCGGFILGRFSSSGWQWIDSLSTSQWSPTQVGQLLAYLPFVPETWRQSERLLGQDESPYWTQTTANPYETTAGLEPAIDKLIVYGRPLAAIRCLNVMLHAQQSVDSERAQKALLATLGSTESRHQNDTYAIVNVIKALQDDETANPVDVSRVEWAYLPLLDQHRGASAKRLENQLATAPQFFCELIRSVFRSKKEEQPTLPETESAKTMASNAFLLLNEWKVPPGLGEDGNFDAHLLHTWLDQVKKECTETGHLNVAMTMVGQVLIHAPADPGGLWIHRSVSAVLNAKDADKMREGFRIALLNSRGLHGFTAGKAERDLAEKYRARAQSVEAAGFQRLASSLMELVAHYEREAERESSRDPFDG